MLGLPDGTPLYAAPAAAQPSRTALGDELLAAIEALHIGCTEQSWIGWQNGDGEEVGTRLQAAIDAYKAAQPSEAQPAPELREVLRDSLASGLTGYMRECDLYPAADCNDLLDELCDLAIAIIGPRAAPLPEAGSAALDIVLHDPWVIAARKADHFCPSGLSSPDKWRWKGNHMRGLLQGKAVSAAPAGEVERDAALNEAVAALYFNDNSKYEGALWNIVYQLSPSIHEILQIDPCSAYNSTKE